MGVLDFFKNRYKNYQYAKMLNGYTPIFSQFGDDIYASDVVLNSVRCIANEISKLQPTHIRVDDSGMQTTVKSTINRLLRISPNPLMTTKDFLEKIVWLRERTNNCFIYPSYYLSETGKRIYTGFYPLNPIQVEFLQDSSETLFLKMYFGNGEEYTFPYADIIHWRKDYSMNEMMGGNDGGLPNNEALLKLLSVNHTITEGLEKGIRTSLNFRGIMKINTMLNDEAQDLEREKFERKLASGDSGILPMDMKGEFIPMNIDPKLIDKDTLEFIDTKILNHYGVSLAIYRGDFTDEQYQAFYEKTLEPMIISLGQLFTKALLSTTEIDHGNEIIFYPQKLLFTNTKNRIAVADILGNRGALTDNQLLELFGYPPFDGGEKRHMSLNFINRDIADQYQVQTKLGKQEGKQSEVTKK